MALKYSLSVAMLLWNLLCFGQNQHIVPKHMPIYKYANDSTLLHEVRLELEKKYDQLANESMLHFDHILVRHNPLIHNYYQRRSYEPIWLNKKNRGDLFKIIEDSHLEGLLPHDYHFLYMIQLNNRLKQNIRLTPQEIANADILLSDAYYTYLQHLINGKIHPESLDPLWSFKGRHIADSTKLRLEKHIDNETIHQTVVELRPQLALYSKLQKWYSYYDSLRIYKKPIPLIEYPKGKALRLGDSANAVVDLKIALREYDYKIDSLDFIFDQSLDVALKDFQSLNGLEPDGIAGKKTYEALNVPLKTRLDKIRVNMERCRWIGENTDQEFLLVNIADYKLYQGDNGDLNYLSRVVVGKEHHETPIINSQIKYVVINPTWTIPYSIMTKEMLPKLKKDPSYLPSRNMTLYKNGSVIDPAEVDFSVYSTHNFPFSIVQGPGQRNALGRFKFIFPNNFSVYLHDTPSKSFFNLNDRAFSHGCVRVQNPQNLAELLLQDKGYDQDKIKEVLKTEKTTNIFLSKAMPIKIMYWTAFQLKDSGKLHFYNDIYGRDARVLSALNTPRTF